MKTKLLLFMLLSLFAVQGWASPVDSLETPNPGNFIHGKLSGLNLCNGFNKLNGLDGLSVVDRTKGPVVAEDIPWWLGLLLGQVPIIHISEVNSNENFIDVPVGSIATKKYEIWGVHTYLFDNIKLELCIKPQSAPPIYSDMFTVDKTSFRGSDIDMGEGGHRETITITYKPTAVGTHKTKLDFGAIVIDTASQAVGLVVDCQEWPPLKFCISGNAVARHFKTSGALSFNDQTVGLADKQYIHVSGSNLNGPITVELDDKTGMYSIDKRSITADEVANGADVEVTYKPTSGGSHGASITFTEEGILETVKLDLSGTAVERHLTASALQSFRTLTVGESDTIPIHVEGTNLNGPVTVTLDDYNMTGMYSINKCSIDPDATGTIKEDVLLIYTPTTIGTHGVAVDISGGGASEAVSVVLIGHCEVPAHIISVDPTELNFGTVVVGNTPPSKSFTVTGTNLTNDLVLSLPPECSHYTISTTRITPDDAADGKLVTVTYHPSATGSHNVTLKIDEEGMYQGGQLVHLSGQCVATQSINVSPSTYDFGTVYAETTNTAIFTVTGTNLSERISLIWPQEDGFTISPTDLPATGGKVTVTFKPTYEGRYSQEFTLSSGNVSAKINVTGESVIPPTIKSNVATLDFGTVIKGNQRKKHFTVTGINLTGDLTLSASKPWFTVSPATITAADAAAGKEVTVIYSPTSGGNHNATLTISGGGAPDKKISLTGKCSAIDIAPSSSHNFGTVKEGSINTATFTVTGTNISERISLVWLQEDGFTITPADLPASGGKVTVTFKPTSGGNYSQQYNLSSGNTSAKITVTGKCAAITPSRSSLNFGTIAKGKEKTDTFKVKGTYLTGDLTLSSSSSMFKVSPDRITASEAAAGKIVTVTYKPTVKGSHSATITISGGDAVPKLVQLTGKCVVPVITTSTNSINYMGKESKQFKVTGTDLTGNLTLTIIGSGKNYFNLSKTSITASAAASGVNVSVLCNAPSTLSSASAQVKISGGDAVTKYVDLYYNQNQPQAINSVQPGTQDESGNDNSNNEFTNGVMLEMTGPLTTDVNELLMSAKVYAEGLNIIIETPIEQKALISDIAGHVREVNLKAGRNEIPVNANGVFIVRIREKTTKLMLK